MSKKFSDYVEDIKFHPEIESELVFNSDIVDIDILIYDVSKTMVAHKSKYNSTATMILFSYIEDSEKTLNLAWLTGQVVQEQLAILLNKKVVPDTEGIQSRLTKTNYYKFV